MKSSHVLIKYVTCGPGRTVLLDLGPEDITRILSFSWIPLGSYASREEYGVILEQELEESGYAAYVPVYKVRYADPSVGGNENASAFVFAEIPSHGLLFKGSVKLLSDPSPNGVGAAFFTYQTG